MRLALCGEGPVEPTTAITAYLSQHPPSLEDPVHLVFGMRRSSPSLPCPLVPGLTVGTFVPGRGLRDVTPLAYDRWSYSEICQAIRSGEFTPDVVIACATTEDSAGVSTLGAIDGYLGLAMDAAKMVVVEEVSWLPHISGAAVVPKRHQRVLSPSRSSDHQPHFSAPYDEVDLMIARHIVPLIPSSPRLALGIGRIPEALGDLLEGRGDVEIVTGVITSTVQRLAGRGALREGPSRAMSVVGPPSLLDWAAQPGRVELYSSSVIHDRTHLASLSNFVAVLGAVTVDRAGNVNSERSRQGLVSGRGGAPDFAAGAHASPGGLSVVALRSTDSGGRSRLENLIKAPTIAADEVDVVVTQNGAARLCGLSAAAKDRALAAIF